MPAVPPAGGRDEDPRRPAREPARQAPLRSARRHAARQDRRRRAALRFAHQADAAGGGKSEGEVSTTFSLFRTGLSEHRTRLSEHRTDLSEHRTDLSDFRTELSQHRTDLSEHRTNLSEHRTELSEHRTTLSYDRSHLSNERTHLSYLRTGISLLSFGVTLNRFAVALAQGNGPGGTVSHEARMRSTEYIGLGMAILGTLLLLWSLYRYRTTHQQIMGKAFKAPSASLMFWTLCVVGLGAVTSIVLIVVK
jgi:putative membrane protein